MIYFQNRKEEPHLSKGYLVHDGIWGSGLFIHSFQPLCWRAGHVSGLDFEDMRTLGFITLKDVYPTRGLHNKGNKEDWGSHESCKDNKVGCCNSDGRGGGVREGLWGGDIWGLKEEFSGQRAQVEQRTFKGVGVGLVGWCRAEEGREIPAVGERVSPWATAECLGLQFKEVRRLLATVGSSGDAAVPWACRQVSVVEIPRHDQVQVTKRGPEWLGLGRGMHKRHRWNASSLHLRIHFIESVLLFTH